MRSTTRKRPEMEPLLEIYHPTVLKHPYEDLI